MAQCPSCTERTLLEDMINKVSVPQTLIDNISMLTGDLFRSFVKQDVCCFCHWTWESYAHYFSIIIDWFIKLCLVSLVYGWHFNYSGHFLFALAYWICNSFEEVINARTSCVTCWGHLFIFVVIYQVENVCRDWFCCPFEHLSKVCLAHKWVSSVPVPLTGLWAWGCVRHVCDMSVNITSDYVNAQHMSNTLGLHNPLK